MRFRKIILFSSFIAIIVSISLFNIHCTSSPKAETLVYKNHADGVQYVGMNTCRGCHSDIYETFIETGMGKSFGAATHSKSAGHFGKHSLIYDKELDFYYLPYFQ